MIGGKGWLALLGGGLVIGLLFASGVIRNPVDPVADEIRAAPRVRALRAEWALTELGWVDYGDGWRLDVTVVMVRNREYQLAADAVVVNALCGAILTDLPEVPDGVNGRADIFRLSLNFWAIAEGELTGERLLPAPIPVSVVDGACQPPEEDDFYVLTYAGIDPTWRFWGYGSPNPSELQVHFNWMGEGDPPYSAFPYRVACQGTVLDPPAYSTFAIDEPDTELVIAAGVSVNQGGEIETIGQWQRFRIADGQCVAMQEGETL